MGSAPVDIIKGGCWDILRCWELHLGDDSCHPAGVCVVCFGISSCSPVEGPEPVCF